MSNQLKISLYLQNFNKLKKIKVLKALVLKIIFLNNNILMKNIVVRIYNSFLRNFNN